MSDEEIQIVLSAVRNLLQVTPSYTGDEVAHGYLGMLVENSGINTSHWTNADWETVVRAWDQAGRK